MTSEDDDDDDYDNNDDVDDDNNDDDNDNNDDDDDDDDDSGTTVGSVRLLMTFGSRSISSKIRWDAPKPFIISTDTRPEV